MPYHGSGGSKDNMGNPIPIFISTLTHINPNQLRYRHPYKNEPISPITAGTKPQQ